jgi:hypothetical protein
LKIGRLEELLEVLLEELLARTVSSAEVAETLPVETKVLRLANLPETKVLWLANLPVYGLSAYAYEPLLYPVL